MLLARLVTQDIFYIFHPRASDAEGKVHSLPVTNNTVGFNQLA
jgi:hypothetical protein